MDNAPLALPPLPLQGTCAFRMMPTDELADAGSAARLSQIGDQGLVLSYTWSHPSDGEQHGSVLVGAADEDGQVQAAWFDTWHQQPGLMSLSGRRTGSLVELHGSYAEEWGWTIVIEPGADAATMTMCNVVPESALAMAPADAPPMSAGPYEVMVARWSLPA